MNIRDPTAKGETKGENEIAVNVFIRNRQGKDLGGNWQRPNYRRKKGETKGRTEGEDEMAAAVFILKRRDGVSESPRANWYPIRKTSQLSAHKRGKTKGRTEGKTWLQPLIPSSIKVAHGRNRQGKN